MNTFEMIICFVLYFFSAGYMTYSMGCTEEENDSWLRFILTLISMVFAFLFAPFVIGYDIAKKLNKNDTRRS